MKKKIFIVIILFALGFFASYTFALYRGSTTGTATLNGATWSVSATGGNSLNLTAGSTASYNLTVTNNSEVDVLYSVELSNLPSGIKVKLDDGSYVTESNNTVTFSNVGTILYGGSPVVHTLTFTTDIDSSVVSGRSIGINVAFKQKLN